MQKTQAAVIREQGVIRIEEITVEDPRPDEVLVRIHASGICRTDLDILDRTVDLPLPLVAGHEGAGIVEAVGSEVTTIAPGDTVALGAAACGRCARCQAGDYTYCENYLAMNFTGSRLDGTRGLRDATGAPLSGHLLQQSSWAGYSLSHVSNTIKMPTGVDPTILAPLGCGLQTGAGAVWSTLNVQPGTSVAVFGTGAVGQAAIMAAKAAGATTIVAVGNRRPRLDLAVELGATHTVSARDGDVVEQVRDLTDGGVQYSVEAVGRPQSMAEAVHVLVETGHAAITGVSPGAQFTLDAWAVLRGRSVHGTTLGDMAPAVALPRMLQLYQQGRFPIDRLVTRYSLSDIDRAIKELDSGDTVKAVLVP
jgi:aryl-alcohol dehydrogenase